jgi:hypothetical protein
MGSELRPPQHPHGVAEVRPACYQDIVSLEDRLRPADLLEIKAAGTNPRDGLTECLLSSSKAFTVTLNGTPIAIFGVPLPSLASPLWPLRAFPWEPCG